MTVVLLVVVVFSVGVLLGGAYQSSGADEVSRALRQSELDAESFLVEQELFDSFSATCALAQSRLREQSLELGRLGKLLGTGDARERLGDADFGFLKKKFHLMQIRTYVLEKKFADQCGRGANVVLYYYEQNDPQSEEQGRILDALVDEFGLHVFAIERGYARELRFLEDYYGVTEAPSIVVNFGEVRTGLTSSEDLVALLNG